MIAADNLGAFAFFYCASQSKVFQCFLNDLTHKVATFFEDLNDGRFENFLQSVFSNCDFHMSPP